MAPGWIDRFLNWGGKPEARSYAAWPYTFSFGGVPYTIGSPSYTLGQKQEPPDPTFSGYIEGIYKSNGVVFACMAVRMRLFSEARFQFRQRRSGRPGDLFGTPELDILETPWANATTGDLLARSILDVDLGGNSYWTRRGNQLFRMRPDWVTIVLGSNMDPDSPGLALDAEVIGYLYQPGGYGDDPVALLPEQVCHFAPNPDPAARFRGMSWLTPIISDLMSDDAATAHKQKFFEQGATVNLAVKMGGGWIKTQEQFDSYVAAFKREHEGVANAFKTLFLGEGMDVVPVGVDLQQSEFKAVQGAGETRIAAAAGVPPVIVGLSEGLAAATYSNYGQARRAFADLTMRPLWRNMAGSLAQLITVPTNAELWYDDRDIPFLQEDVQDDANARATDAGSIAVLINAGFEPDAVIDSVNAGDIARLKGRHTGLSSVQLQPPAESESEPAANGNGTPIGVTE